jgi:hypothetical protein
MREYVRKTGRGNGADIVYTVVALRLGRGPGTDWIAASIERIREWL